MRIDDPQHGVSDTFGLGSLRTQGRCGETRIRQDLEVIFRNGWGGKVAERRARIVVANRIGQQFEVERVGRQRGELVDQPVKDRQEGLYVL